MPDKGQCYPPPMPGLALLFTGLLIGAALLVLAVVATVAFLFWLAALAMFLVGWFKPSRPLRWIGGVPLVGIPVLGLVFAGLLVWAAAYSQSPVCAYESVFHEAPTAAVSDLHGDLSGWGDSCRTRLVFHADRATFDRLLPKDLTRTSLHDAQRMHWVNASDPAWWREPDASWEIHFRQSDPEHGQPGKVLASETEMMAFNPATGTVVYAFDGVD